MPCVVITIVSDQPITNLVVIWYETITYATLFSTAQGYLIKQRIWISKIFQTAIVLEGSIGFQAPIFCDTVDDFGGFVWHPFNIYFYYIKHVGLKLPLNIRLLHKCVPFTCDVTEGDHWEMETTNENSDWPGSIIMLLLRLTYQGGDKMAVLSQTIFSNAFWLNKNVWIPLKISPKFVPTIRIQNSIGSDNGLAPTRRQAIIWTNDG